MKTLIFIDEEFQAERIVKGEDYIVGYDLDKNEVFAFRGITDFSSFSLKDNAEWDLPDPKPRIPKIVDNLEEGGRDDVLSAEQGKVIKGKYDETTTELTRLATTMATNVQAGLAKIDNQTIKTNANGQLYATVAEWKSIDYGMVAYGLFNRELQVYNSEGAWFRLGLGSIHNERRYQIDLSFTPVGQQNENIILDDYDISIGFEVDANGVFKDGRYHSQTATFDLSGLMISLNELGGEYFLAIRLSKTTGMADSAMLLCSVDKFVIKGTNGKTAYLEEVQNLNYSIQDDMVVAGVNPKLTITNTSKIGSLNLNTTMFEYNILNSTFDTSGYYMVQTLTPKSGDDFTQPIMAIVHLSRGKDSLDGTIMRFWTAYEITFTENVPFTAEVLNTYHMMDGIYQGQYIATGNWKKHGGADYSKLKTDVQTLFTDWANEIDNMATALSQKGVATPQGSTAKTITTNIGLIPSGKKIYRETKSASGSKAFTKISSGTMNMNYVTVSLSTLGFKAGIIIAEDSNFAGGGTTITSFSGVVSAHVYHSNTSDTGTGIDRWFRLYQSGMPTTGNIDIPVDSASNWNIIIIEE